MTTANDVLIIARRQIGIAESPPNSNRQKFGEWYGWNGVPWCAQFVSYCFYHAGMPLKGIQHEKGFAYCPYGVNHFRKLGRFDRNYKAGDIVFFDWRGDGVADHVGIVESVKSNVLVTIEGNTSYADNSNGGLVMRRSRRTNWGILGVAHPDYGSSTVVGRRTLSWPGRYLMLASPMLRGEDVEEWQRQLIELKFDLGRAGADGWFGEKTDATTKAFQEKNGLEVDGIVGPITWEAGFKENLDATF